MSDLEKKKIGKLVGMKKNQFNEHIKSKQIKLSKARLIPTFKTGEEMALTSVLLASFKLVSEFREDVFGEIGLSRGGKLYAYTEVSFDDFPECRLDGMMLVVKSGVIKDVAIFEMKNGNDILDKDQLDRYQRIAKQYKIPRFVTISNQFVSDSTQSPVEMRVLSGIEMRHFSWSYLLTLAHLLVFKNTRNIEDSDQKSVMTEVISYLEHPKSGVIGVTQMSKGWVEVSRKIVAGISLKVTDEELRDAVLSWQQEEKNLALGISRELGTLVSTGPLKFRGKLDERLKADCKELVESNQLNSIYRVRGAVSDILVSASFDMRKIEASVSLRAPDDKTLRGQVGWIRRQFETCSKKSDLFEKIADDLMVDIYSKASRGSRRFTIGTLDDAIQELKGKEVREFQIILFGNLGAKFASPKKFVEAIENLIGNFYAVIVQNLTKWEPQAPRVKEVSNELQLDEERFIDTINQSPMINFNVLKS